MNNYQPNPADSDPKRPWLDPSRFDPWTVFCLLLCFVAIGTAVAYLLWE